MKSFTPMLVIGIGETSAYFTLRETYLHEQWVGGQDGYMDREIRSYHLFNLSQDAATAVEKAKAHSEVSGVELSHDINTEHLQTQMREIHRATAEQLTARQASIQADRDAYEAQQQAWDAEAREKINSGVFAIGPYVGKKFTEAPLGYLNWLMDKVEDFEPDSIIRLTAEVAAEMHPELRLPRPDPEKVVGEVGKRMSFKDVKVIRSFSFMRPGFGYYDRPQTCYITTMVTTDGVCLVCFSSAFSPDVGEVISFKATVKEHSDYKGQAQTIIQRVKEEAVKNG